FLLADTFVMTFAALLIVEIFPKTVFRSRANRLVLLFSKFLLFVHYLFYIPSFILSSLISPFIKEKNKSIFITRDEISSIAEAARDDGAISDDEIKYIRSILDFGETEASEIIVPLIEMFAVSEKTTVRNAISIMSKRGLNYLTVYSERIDNVVGYFTLKDAVFSKKSDLSLLLKKPQFVPFSMPVDEVFLLMRDNDLTVVYVVNEYGGIMGYIDFVTIVDEIMGDIGISDNLGLIKKISSNKYLLEADIEIEDLAEKLEIILPEGDYETLNGFIVSSMKKIPDKNEKFIYKNYEFQISERNNRNISKVLLIIKK
ncbi:MAG: DUF21 domain-containing protein, partial [Actinomycetia bacterium]|nr:DUF21 domain-containing protein [Actinomycetes bacterium]